MAKQELLTTTMEEFRYLELIKKADTLTEDYFTELQEIGIEIIETNGWIHGGFTTRTSFVKWLAKRLNRSKSYVWKLLSEPKAKTSTDSDEDGDDSETKEDQDHIGRDLPDCLKEIFSRAKKEIGDVVRDLNSALSVIRDKQGKEDGLWEGMPHSTIEKAILEDVKKFNPKCSFPTIIIGEKVIVGFRENEIREALGL